MQHAHRNAVNWFEIPVADLDRAQRFYETLLDAPLKREAMGPETTLAVFPYERGAGIGGCLFAGAHAPTPSDDGTVVYLDASPSLDAALARVDAAGGRIVVPRTDLPEGMGAFAQIVDSEGNRVGLHAPA
ncbi:MAG: VOC family protein [Lysobacteraceae bacterium]